MIFRPLAQSLLCLGVALLSACGDSTGPEVATVALLPATMSLEVGDTAELTSVVKDSYGNLIPNQLVQWSSSDTTVATVDSTGLVLARGVGSAQVRAILDGIVGTASVQVLDSMAPALVTLAMLPDTINVGTSSGSVVVRARVTDSGVGTARMAAIATSPNNAAVKSCEATVLSEGTASNGTWSCTISFPKGSAAGTWAIAVLLEDKIGNQHESFAPELDAAGLPSSLVVTGTDSDSDPPVLTELSLSPDTINVGAESGAVTVRARVTDSGVGTARMAVIATSPNNAALKTCETTALSGGTASDGTWSCSISFPKGSASGKWDLAVLIEDKIGNQHESFSSELIAAGLPAFVTVK